ncbi:MAG: DNA-binding response regulator [Hyphomonas sp.]|uniref:response regulator transcription factor n=1 Tax=Hyphomonas sp. TaxID=87 RepID=UPI001D49329D|nr:response regulator transcription factor [Hyphomonas sp.]MBA4043641.1 DNA-binding response regulator [Erythrobacter sp.]MBA4046909.1 DNA-binding response regulator [Sphingomonas sp.]MBA4081576.1 DNA-binding response regulator [Erythrobacter sp.]MBA4228728.1 DNA-binding response regulator [Hyphomonas sp.]
MRKDVLIIDDEPAIRRLLIGALDRVTITHVEAATAAEALRIASAAPAPLVALLDLGLPDRDGLEVVPQLAALSLSVIVLTARDATEEKVAALDLGADDFVTKPFDSEELLARIRSALRRKAGPLSTTARRQFASGHIDRDAHEVVVRGEHVDLTPREFDLLWTLADYPGRVVTHDRLLELVWGPAHRHDLNYLRVAVRSLRRKLESNPGEPQLIINEPGVGYRVAG